MGVSITGAAVLSWLLSLGDQAKPLFDALKAVGQATDFPSRVKAVKVVADLLFDLAATFPVAQDQLQLHASASLESLEAKAQGLGLDWSTLLSLIPEIEAMIQAIISLIGKVQPKTSGA